MSLHTKQAIIAALGALFLISLIFVQGLEVARRREEAGISVRRVSIPESSKRCVECHQPTSPGIVDHWKGSTHARKGVGCVECHQADPGDADAFSHEGHTIATIVTPLDCSRCHKKEYDEFEHSHHAKAGDISRLAGQLPRRNGRRRSAQSRLTRIHPLLGMNDYQQVNGLASVDVGCKQCHGGKVALQAEDGGLITVDRPQAGRKRPDRPLAAAVAPTW